MFGTLALTSSTIFVIAKPSPTFSIVHGALVSTLVGGVPFPSSAALSAMLKHAASAAASSSSGFDPSPFSKRELKLYWPPRPVAPLNDPRPALQPTFPLRARAACRHAGSPRVLRCESDLTLRNGAHLNPTHERRDVITDNSRRPSRACCRAFGRWGVKKRCRRWCTTPRSSSRCPSDFATLDRASFRRSGVPDARRSLSRVSRRQAALLRRSQRSAVADDRRVSRDPVLGDQRPAAGDDARDSARLRAPADGGHRPLGTRSRPQRDGRAHQALRAGAADGKRTADSVDDRSGARRPALDTRDAKPTPRSTRARATSSSSAPAARWVRRSRAWRARAARRRSRA